MLKIIYSIILKIKKFNWQLIIFNLLFINLTSCYHQRHIYQIYKKPLKIIPIEVLPNINSTIRVERIENFGDYYINLYNKINEISSNIKESSIFVSNVKNNTNDILPVNEIKKNIISSLLDNEKKVRIIDSDTEINRKKLNNFNNFNLENLNDEIRIASYLKAEYILYTIIDGNKDKPELRFKLISVKTGEIVCQV